MNWQLILMTGRSVMNVQRPSRRLDGMVKQIKYLRGGDNSFLRLALYEAWNQRCYWCKKPTDFLHIQIDHIVPKSLTKEQWQLAQKEFDLAPDYDLNALHNLAPICHDCNGAGEKGDAVLMWLPGVARRQRKAAQVAPTVSTAVQKLKDSPVQARNLIKVAQMDLAHEDSRKLFASYAPAIVQKLVVAVGEEPNYTSSDGFHLNPDTGRPFVDVMLESRGRRSRDLIEHFLGQDFTAMTRSICLDLLDCVERELGDLIERELLNTSLEQPVVGQLTAIFEYLTVSELDFERDGDCITFTWGGTFQSDYFASMARSGADGELEDGQVEARLETRWRATAECGLDAGAECDVAAVGLFETDSWVDGSW